MPDPEIEDPDGLAHLFADLDLEGARWVTLAEAEDATGVSRSALRAWFRNDEIPARIEDGPHGPQRLVPLDAVVDRARQAGERIGKARRSPGRDSSDGTGDEMVRQMVGALMDQLVSARAELADLRRRVEALERDTQSDTGK